MEIGEIAFRGRRWTWANNRNGEGFIDERLDMFFGSSEWFVHFGRTEVQHLLTQASDHSMGLLDTKPQQQKSKSRFIFYHRWSKVLGCEEVIQNNWNVHVEGSRMFKFHKKVQQCRKGLLEWRKKENSNSMVHIECLKRDMESMQNKGGQREWERWHSLKAQLEGAYKDEEAYWTRKSRVEWLTE